MKKLNNKGFGVVEGLLILVIIGIVGGTIFYVRKSYNNVNSGSDGTTISHNQKAEDQTEAQPVEEQQAESEEDVNKGYLVVDEWGVRIKLRDADRVKSYSYDSKASDIFGIKYDSSITPVINPHNSQNTNCKSIGVTMFRSKTNPNVDSKKVDGYYFFMTGSPGQCTDDPDDPDNQLNIRLIKDFNPRNIEALP